MPAERLGALVDPWKHNTVDHFQIHGVNQDKQKWRMQQASLINTVVSLLFKLQMFLQGFNDIFNAANLFIVMLTLCQSIDIYFVTIKTIYHSLFVCLFVWAGSVTSNIESKVQRGFSCSFCLLIQVLSTANTSTKLERYSC